MSGEKPETLFGNVIGTRDIPRQILLFIGHKQCKFHRIQKNALKVIGLYAHEKIYFISYFSSRKTCI